nr:hypothetical protein LVJ77_00545 [Conchiformibius kuhniae]
MRKFFSKALAVVVLGAVTVAPAVANDIDDVFYTTSYSLDNKFSGARTFSIQFDRAVHSAVIHITGIFHGKCLRTRKSYAMNYENPSQETNTSGGNVNAQYGGLSAGYHSQATLMQNRPARFVFKKDLPLRAVKYNIVFVRNGQVRSTGWLPYDGIDPRNGGCIYNVGVRKSSKAP